MEVPEIKRSTIGPGALADFVQEFKTRELASFVFAGKCTKVFDFNLTQRNKKRRELEVKRLWFLGLNHLSAGRQSLIYPLAICVRRDSGENYLRVEN